MRRSPAFPSLAIPDPPSWLTSPLPHGLFSASYTETNHNPKTPMKVLLRATCPHHTFNAAVKDGTAGAKLHKILEALKPEAVYFTEFCGKRTAVVIVDLPDASKIP